VESDNDESRSGLWQCERSYIIALSDTCNLIIFHLLSRISRPFASHLLPARYWRPLVTKPTQSRSRHTRLTLLLNVGFLPSLSIFACSYPFAFRPEGPRRQSELPSRHVRLILLLNADTSSLFFSSSLSLSRTHLRGSTALQWR
jgi:hypothetical protein